MRFVPNLIMKRQTFLSAFFICLWHLSNCQQDSTGGGIRAGTSITFSEDSTSDIKIIDDTPLGLGLLIRNVRNSIKQDHPEILITRETILEKKVNAKGELALKLFTNSDAIEIVAWNLNRKNYRNYKAFQQINLSNEISKEGLDRPVSLIPSDDFKTIFLFDQNLDEGKFNLANKYVFYYLKDSSGNIVSKITLQFAVPKPEPYFISIDAEMLRVNELNPVGSVHYESDQIHEMMEELNSVNLSYTKPLSRHNYPEKLILPFNKNSFFIVFKSLQWTQEEFLEYRIESDSIWRKTPESVTPTIILKNLPIGKQKLQVRYPGFNSQENNLWEYEFEIKPHWTHTTAFIVSTGIIIVALVCWILFRRHNRIQKAKLNQEILQRKQVQNQIQSLRSQLDPHFIFNSLNSIQSLINRNDIAAANLYISKFGALLHDILEKNDAMMQPLAIELRQIEHYLQLEQLRFRFSYKINVDNSINSSEIDIPMMLLQPYVENAIKHGIVEKQEEGKIELRITRKDNEMIISITDNGKGYDTATNKEGHGSRLVAERVEKMNRLLNDQKISVELNSAIDKETNVSIHFTNWL
jgi:hypothetical protein